MGRKSKPPKRRGRQRKRKPRSIETFREYVDALRPKAMITLDVPAIEHPKDEAVFARRLRDLLINALKNTRIKFVQKREWSRDFKLHYHIGLSEHLSPELVEIIKDRCLRLIGKPNNRGTPFDYEACKNKEEAAKLANYLKKEFDKEKYPFFNVIKPPPKYAQTGWMSFYKAHRLQWRVKIHRMFRKNG